MDSFAALALATELPTMKLLDRPPYSRDEYIVNRKMVKNLLGMSIFQIFIVYAIVFAGEYFFPEPDVHYRFGRDSPFLFPGRVTDWDGSPLWSKYEAEYGSSRHMTNCFNVFVVLQIFNLINNRTITDEFNVFKGLFANGTFLVVLAIISIGQVLIVEFGSYAFKCSNGGISWEQWLIAVFCGLLTWVWALVMKFVPDTWCP